jgi:prepilin-type N-terminal cleavage/methylation domain-containing protein
MTRLRDEAGFTLTELLVAMTVGLLVLFALIGLLDTSTRLSASTVDRIETSARARLAMDLLTRQVRSQLCLGTDLPALTVATPTSMTFYGSIAPEASPLIVQRRTLTYDPATKRLLQTVWTGAGTRPNVTFDTAPQSSVIAEGIIPDGTAPIFAYYRFQVPAVGAAARPALITTTPLGTDDLASTVQVGFNLVAVGRRPATRVEMSSTVYVRTSNPTNPDNSPLCL